MDKILGYLNLIGLTIFSIGIGFSITVAQIGLYVFILLPFVIRLIVKKKILVPKSKITIAALLLIIAYIIASVTGINFAKSFVKWKRLLLFFIIFLTPALATSLKRLRLSTDLSIAVITGNSIYGILESIFHFTYSMQRYGKVGGTFHFSMTFGGVLVVFTIFIYGRIFLEGNWKGKVIYGLSFLLLLTSMFLTRERNAMLGTFGGLFLFTLIRDRRYFPVFLIPFVILYFSLPNVKRTVTNTSFEEYSVNQRLSMYKASPQVFKNHWLSGVGPGNVKEAYQDEVKEYKMKYSHVHNIYLQILLETGIIGFISFLWLFFEVIKLSILLYKNRKNALVRNTALAAGCGIVGFLIAGLFENNFGDTEVVMPVFFLIGILVAIKNEELN